MTTIEENMSNDNQRETESRRSVRNVNAQWEADRAMREWERQRDEAIGGCVLAAMVMLIILFFIYVSCSSIQN